MSTGRLLKLLLILGIVISSLKSNAQNPVNWTPDQLIEPSALASDINANKALPIIISVGPGALIPNSVNAGMASTDTGMAKLKEVLKNVPKDKKIVVYCGCCPFEHCPNVRPAIAALQEMHFTNYYLLDLSHNIKKDWIDEGYPVVKQ